MQLTRENEARFGEILKRYPVKRSALLPTLHLVQEQEGWISGEAIEHVAGLLDLSPAQVHDTASFYTMFRLRPEGKTLIEVCTTLSCALGGAEELLAHTCRRLGIKPGETTPDGKFTVKGVECLAACGGAPAVQVDGAWLEHALGEAGTEVIYQHGVDRVLAAVRSGEAAAGVLIRPVSVAEIERTAREGLLMPPKSTFFTPKLRTGLVVRPLA